MAQVKARVPEYMSNTLKGMTKLQKTAEGIRDLARHDKACEQFLGLKSSCLDPRLRSLKKLDQSIADLEKVYDQLTEVNAEYEMRNSSREFLVTTP